MELTNQVASDTWSRPRPPAPIVYMLGALSGVVGMVAAFQQEFAHGLGLASLTAGPIEELCKPLVLIIILDRRPWWIKRRGEVFLLALLAAALFAVLENILYLNVALQNPSAAIRAFRWTVCTGLHLCCSAIVAVGLAAQWRKMVATGERFRLGGSFMRYYLIGASIHAAHNGTVWMLEKSGVMTW